jgi:hypothetical protein
MEMPSIIFDTDKYHAAAQYHLPYRSYSFSCLHTISLGVGPNSLKRRRDQLGQKRELSETTLEPCMIETVLSLSRNATWCAVSFKHLSCRSFLQSRYNYNL